MFGNIFTPFWKKIDEILKRKLDKIMKKNWLHYYENNFNWRFFGLLTEVQDALTPENDGIIF